MVQYLLIKSDTSHKKKKDKNHIIISIDTEKVFDKTQHPFMIVSLNKVGMEGAHLNTIKPIYEKSTASVKLYGAKLKRFP